MEPRDAGRLARMLEPLHAMTYFAPETEQHLTAIGLRGGRMPYFAGRSSPMGAVSAKVVAATFYNFSPSLVARSIPDAWSLADPAKVVAARFASVDAALHRMLGAEVIASPEVLEAASLARRATEACTVEGRPLAAGHLEVDWPVESHLVLWHAVSILREHRGDGHVALLLAAGLSGIEAIVSYTATGRGFITDFARASRGWSQQEWDATIAGLAERGVLDAEGGLTEDGAALRKRIEHDTDRLGFGPWAHLGAEDAARLGEIGAKLVTALIDAGCFPAGIQGSTPR